jgi:hypothetical protein
MKNIFISYARADRVHAADLAEALGARGHGVWWDWNLVGGENFRVEIRNQLDRADKVIVIWSETSASSAFVIDEVSAARSQNKLIPTNLDGAKPPFGFGDLHTLPLSKRAADIDRIADAIMGKASVLPPRPWYAKVRAVNAIGALTLVAIALAGSALYFAGRPTASRQVFDAPKTERGEKIDVCLHWARECGEPAATFWCRSKGFRTSFDYKVAGNVPPTFVQGDNRICDIPVCAALTSITCEK